MTAKWIADIRVGCVAVYDGTRVNCLSGITESPHCIFYRHGRWVEDNKPGCGHWEVDPQDEETAVSLARKLNSHDALVAALRMLLVELPEHKCRYDGPMGCDTCIAVEQARAALKLIEE